MIHCKDISKSFQGKTVLNGITFDVPKGEIFGLLGPSGAGKTTLIRILTGQLKYETGEASILGKAVNRLTGTDKKKIGIMMDQFGLYERLSCVDNLKIFAELYGVPCNKIYEILGYVGLGGAGRKPAADLSRGMNARLRLARVLLHAPEMIFLDEPTGGLDPTTMRSVHRLILEKKNTGSTIFLTTHNMEEAAILCDRVALLNEGEIVEMGKPEEICRKYNHKRKIVMHLLSGRDVEVPHQEASAEIICHLLKTEQVETIHSSEPNLEAVFLELTGRKLEDE